MGQKKILSDHLSRGGKMRGLRPLPKDHTDPSYHLDNGITILNEDTQALPAPPAPISEIPMPQITPDATSTDGAPSLEKLADPNIDFQKYMKGKRRSQV